eukprot:12929290-Prorocentrum_lima.AAC.1
MYRASTGTGLTPHDCSAALAAHPLFTRMTNKSYGRTQNIRNQFGVGPACRKSKWATNLLPQD